MSQKPGRRRPRYAPVQMGRTAEAAWEASLSVVVGAGLGFFADRWAGTSPWLTIGFVVLGTIAAFRRLLALSKKEPTDPPGTNGSSPQ